MLTIEEKAAIRLRVQEALAQGDHGHLWSIISNPSNLVSREGVRLVDPSAPAVRASISKWRAWIAARFVDFEPAQAHKAELAEAEREARNAKGTAERLQRVATSGPQWRNNGNIYPHALAFIQAKRAEGYSVESSGIGRVRLVHPSGQFVGPMRNVHINAAVRITEPQA